MHALEAIVVHHSASRRSTTAEDIRAWHKAKGWDDIGYHYVIEGDGKIVIGRPLWVVGAHCPPNTGRVGICVTGNNRILEERWTPAQEAALYMVVTSLQILVPKIQLFAHHELRSTECPGIPKVELQNIVYWEAAS